MDKLISASNAVKIAQEYKENLVAQIVPRFVEEHLIEPVSKKIYAVASEGDNEFLFQHKIEDAAINSSNLLYQIVRHLVAELRKHGYKVTRVGYGGYYMNFTISMHIAWE